MISNFVGIVRYILVLANGTICKANVRQGVEAKKEIREEKKKKERERPRPGRSVTEYLILALSLNPTPLRCATDANPRPSYSTTV